MYPVRRLTLLLAAALVLSACGSSITAVTPRSAGPTQARAVTPFCDAIEQSQTATREVSAAGVGRRIENIDQVADQVRAANQQVSALAPPELRADADRVVAVVDRQLRLLEDSGGDTLALSRDPELTRLTGDPAYAASSRALNDYVRTSC